MKFKCLSLTTTYFCNPLNHLNTTQAQTIHALQFKKYCNTEMSPDRHRSQK